MTALPANPGEWADVRIPTTFRTYTSGETEVHAASGTLRDTIASLEEQFPGIQDKLIDDGHLSKWVSVRVGGQDGPDARLNDGLDTLVVAGEEIHIIPAVAGG